LIYHAAFCLQQSSLPCFIDDVRKHIATKVSFGFINIKGVNSLFKSDVGTHAAIFVVNHKPLCVFTLSMLIFGGLASFNPVELGQIVKETHLQIPEFNFNSDQYKFEDPKLNESYKEALQASKSVAFHLGKAVSGIMRALADGFYEPLKKTVEPVINMLIDYINKKNSK
jgi:hypothetical protein